MEPNFVNTGDQQRLSFSSLSRNNEKILNYGHISIGVLLLAITVSFLANMSTCSTWMNFIHAVLGRKYHKIYYCTTFGRDAKPLEPNQKRSSIVFLYCLLNKQIILTSQQSFFVPWDKNSLPKTFTVAPPIAIHSTVNYVCGIKTHNFLVKIMKHL